MKRAAASGAVNVVSQLSKVCDAEQHHDALRGISVGDMDPEDSSKTNQDREATIRILGKDTSMRTRTASVRQSRRAGSSSVMSLPEIQAQIRNSSLVPYARLLLDLWESREGILHKRGHIVKNWKARIFCLRKAEITYHKPLKVDGVLPPALGRIDLKSASVEPNARHTSVSSNHPFCFGIAATLADGRVKLFTLSASSEEEKLEWIAAVTTNIDMIKSRSSTAC